MGILKYTPLKKVRRNHIKFIILVRINSIFFSKKVRKSQEFHFPEMSMSPVKKDFKELVEAIPKLTEPNECVFLSQVKDPQDSGQGLPLLQLLDRNSRYSPTTPVSQSLGH